MPFLRDNRQELKWQEWLHQNRDALERCGIPQALLENRSHWLYFLDHGYFTPPGSGSPVIDIDRLSIEAMRELCEVLGSEETYRDTSTVRELRNRLAS